MISYSLIYLIRKFNLNALWERYLILDAILLFELFGVWEFRMLSFFGLYVSLNFVAFRFLDSEHNAVFNVTANSFSLPTLKQKVLRYLPDWFL